jgi:hypothetical protein
MASGRRWLDRLADYARSLLELPEYDFVDVDVDVGVDVDVDVNAVVGVDVDDVQTHCRHDCIRPGAFPYQS